MTLAYINGKWQGDFDLDTKHVYEIRKQKRSSAQNRAIHKYFCLVADALNDAGYSVHTVLNRRANNVIDGELAHADYKCQQSLLRVQSALGAHSSEWTATMVKELMWRSFQVALFKERSTTRLSSDDVTVVYRNMDLYLSKSLGIESIPFPSVDNMLIDKIIKEAK